MSLHCRYIRHCRQRHQGTLLSPTGSPPNAVVTTTPIAVQAASGNKMQSTHTCKWDAPTLPAGARAGHILPGLASHSLVSRARLCDNDCAVEFTRHSVRVLHQGCLALEGPRDPKTGLWLLPLKPPRDNAAPAHRLNTPNTGEAPDQYGLFTHRTTSQRKLMQYLHAACYSPVPSMWIAGIRNDHFTTWPGLTARAVTKHLPPSMATRVNWTVALANWEVEERRVDS
jgi:hypothetical protein